MQVTMDDFLEPQPKKIRPAVENVDPIENMISKCINEGIESAREICERFVQAHKEWDKRYRSGKPVIYPRICQRLDQRLNEGELELIEVLSGSEDRLYRKTKDANSL